MLIDYLPNFKNIQTPHGKTLGETITPEMLRMAYQYAYERSPDPNTRIGAVVLETTSKEDEYSWRVVADCNRLPKGIENIKVDLTDRPKKLFYIEHAERNAVRSARAAGFDLNNSWLFCTCYACADCAREVIDSGIKTIIGHKPSYDRNNVKWRDSLIAAHDMFKEAGVDCYLYNDPIGDCKALTDNQEWNP